MVFEMVKYPQVIIDSSDFIKKSRHFDRLAKNYPEEAHDAVMADAEIMAGQMRFFVNKWRSYLSSPTHTRAERTDDGAVVISGYYARFLDEGHFFNPKAAGSSKLQAWAREHFLPGTKKHLSVWYIVNKLGYAQAHPFINNAREQARREFGRIVNHHTQIAMAKSGIGS